MTKPEYELLFIASRQDFEIDHQQAALGLTRENILDWQLVYKTAVKHGVAPLVYANLMHGDRLSLGIPAEIGHKFSLITYQQVIEKQERAHRLQTVLAFFDSQSTEVMLVKSIALEQRVYDYPWMTAAHDIDLILKRRLGELQLEELQRIHHELHGTGIEYDFYEHHDLNINGALPVDFERIWSQAKPVTLYGYPVYQMTPEDLLISVCINNCRKRFFRLKSLCDIAETVRRIPEMDWEQVVSKARDYDCAPILYTSLQVSDRTLGCPTPEGVLDSLEVGWVRRKAIDRTIEYLLDNISLEVYPFLGKSLFGRKLNLAVILPYLNYRGYQIWRKLGEIQAAQNKD